MSSLPEIAALISAMTLSGQTAELPQQRPETLQRLVACRAMTDNAARLACYDAAAGALDTAERQGDLVVIDRAQANETRRQLFGFELPTVSHLFRGGDGADLQAIETTLQSASQAGEGKWVFRLADGGVWRQIDSEPVNFRNRAGQEVRVRRASLGSFLLTVGGSRAVRVRRQ